MKKAKCVTSRLKLFAKDKDRTRWDYFDVPDWHLELVRKEIKNVKNGKSELMDWEETKKTFKL